jgi:hypothetical protein
MGAVTIGLMAAPILKLAVVSNRTGSSLIARERGLTLPG